MFYILGGASNVFKCVCVSVYFLVSRVISYVFMCAVASQTIIIYYLGIGTEEAVSKSFMRQLFRWEISFRWYFGEVIFQSGFPERIRENYRQIAKNL